ncbi:MAG: NUDIX domain-containing protein, partial [Candidatus Nitrosopelagicus sp.]|nr:NUDIX domain-containing protein [Candidatus Nitrosopelagicus sp.]
MHKTKIVTTFLTNSDKILLLKRSQKVKTMKNLWAGISGLIEGDEKPLSRAKIEIFEEVGIEDTNIKLIKEGGSIV